ncbi:carbonic anhydrase [bacterium]|nr:MAG: carbonic anhydrase [bacterium]
MKKISIVGGALALFLSFGPAVALASEGAAGNPDESLAKLMEGNARYVKGAMTHPDANDARREEVAKGQHPFAIILGCSDSRVPPEVIFDQGLGDLFIIRTAGHVVDDVAIGSIEYAAEHLGSPLLVVLGHERCGAVKATVDGGEAPGHIESIVKAIKPAVEKAKGEEGDLVDNSVKENVELVREKLLESKPILAELVEKGKLKIVGARYDLDDGKVEILK